MPRHRADGEGLLSQRKDGTWQGALRLPGGGRKYYYGPTRARVAAKLAEARAQLAAGVKLGEKRQTVRTYLTWWLEEQAKPRVRPSTYRSHHSYVTRHLIPALGHYRLDQLTPQHVQSFLHAEAQSGRAPATVQQLRAILRRALSYAERWGLVAKNAAALTDRPQGTRVRVQPLTPAQAGALWEALSGERWGTAYRMALATGLRAGELLGLRWSDVAWERQELTVAQQLVRLGGVTTYAAPKTAAGRRTLALGELALSVLRAQRAQQAAWRLELGPDWLDNGLVFTREDGEALVPSTLSHEFSKALERAGLPHQRLHDLRHLHASLLLAQGRSLSEVSATLGHAGIAITSDTYGHLYEEARRGVADDLDAVLRKHGVG
jgi:integrase